MSYQLGYTALHGEVTDGQMVRAGVLGHEVCCHDLESVISNPSRVELGVLSTSGSH